MPTILDIDILVSDGSEESTTEFPEQKMIIHVLPISVQDISFANPDPVVIVATVRTRIDMLIAMLQHSKPSI